MSIEKRIEKLEERTDGGPKIHCIVDDDPASRKAMSANELVERYKRNQGITEFGEEDLAYVICCDE